MWGETSYHLPPGYRLERDPDVLIVRHWDGLFVGAFSVRGVTQQAVIGAVDDDRSGLPPYTGPEEHAESVRRLVRARMKRPWERFLRTERRIVEARKNGQLAKALLLRLPLETQEELDKMASADRKRAEQQLVELRSAEGQITYKHVDQLCPEDRLDRIRAELARIQWLLNRQVRRNIIRQVHSEQRYRSRKSLGSSPDEP
jgi:hypothetical protein